MDDVEDGWANSWVERKWRGEGESWNDEYVIDSFLNRQESLLKSSNT